MLQPIGWAILYYQTQVCWMSSIKWRPFSLFHTVPEKDLDILLGNILARLDWLSVLNFSCIYFKPTGRRFHILNECTSIWQSCAVKWHRFSFGIPKKCASIDVLKLLQFSVHIVLILMVWLGIHWGNTLKATVTVCVCCASRCLGDRLKTGKQGTNWTRSKFLGWIVQKSSSSEQPSKFKSKYVRNKKLKTGWSLNKKKRSFIISNFVSSVNLWHQ